ncbi:MAG TPA: YkgJ family cysteine cluster protein [Lacipirellulaceae bacterium]|nr:YkgJ family cysteine cluster protein [Lacipirellulaceae bacterium]
MTPDSSPAGDRPWYADGLKFQCTGCGDCCGGAPGYVWVNQAEIDALATRLGMTPADFERKYVRNVGVRRTLKERKNYDCVFLDDATRKCTVYEDRPRQCRTWPFWNSNLRSPEAWEATSEACRGCGQGKLYSIEVIEQQAAAIRI